MKIKVKDLRPNPFRKIDCYPINRQKVEALKVSINETTFWDNLLARRGKHGKFEITYGHHRLAALKELGIKEVDIPVRDLDDTMMIKIMADENLHEWRTNPAVVNETILAAKEFLDSELAKCKNWNMANKFICRLFKNAKSFSNAKRDGVGQTTIVNFLGNNWKQWMVQEALVTFKESDEGKINRQATELFPTQRLAKAFRENVVKYEIPIEEQKGIAEEMIKEGLGYNQIETQMSLYEENTTSLYRENQTGVLTENIFSHAVALHQAGRLRNTIYAYKRDVYILNMDYTVILKFELPPKESSFDNPIAFAANDYESLDFREEEGLIIFRTEDPKTNLVRTKTCSGVELSVEGAAKIFSRHYKKIENPKLCRFKFEKAGLKFLEKKLSHLEFKGRNGQWLITQRDIYSGAVIEVEKFQEGMEDIDDLSHDFGPIGIRTNDFVALFSFNDLVMFHFPSDHPQVCLVKGDRYEMKGVIAGCLYDELGEIVIIK